MKTTIYLAGVMFFVVGLIFMLVLTSKKKSVILNP
jgi:hypothetical protein